MPAHCCQGLRQQPAAAPIGAHSSDGQKQTPAAQACVRLMLVTAISPYHTVPFLCLHVNDSCVLLSLVTTINFTAGSYHVSLFALGVHVFLPFVTTRSSHSNDANWGLCPRS